MNAEYYALLREFLSFKTLPFGNDCVKEHKKCGEWLYNLFVKSGFNVRVVNGQESPIILAQYDVGSECETGVIYGNYDVNVAEMKDGWKDDPFSLYFGKDKIFGRGLAGGKAITLLNMFNIFKLIEENKLKYNIIFVIEGEKLKGSKNLIKLFQENNFKADFFFSNIGTVIQKNPILTTGFRGSFNAKIKVKTAEKIGIVSQYGGILQNSIQELSKLLSKIYDSNNRITIPYFYYEVDDISANEKTLNARLPFDKDLVLQEFGAKTIKLDDIDYYSKIGGKPCIEVVSFDAGNTGLSLELLQQEANAVLNFKLVPNQKVDAIKSLFQEWIKSNISKDLDCEISFLGESEPIKFSVSNYFANKAETLLGQIFGKKVGQVVSGFSLPVAKTVLSNVQNIVNVPLVNMDSNIDGVNENMDIELLEKGAEFFYEFFRK